MHPELCPRIRTAHSLSFPAEACRLGTPRGGVNRIGEARKAERIEGEPAQGRGFSTISERKAASPSRISVGSRKYPWDARTYRRGNLRIRAIRASRPFSKREALGGKYRRAFEEAERRGGRTKRTDGQSCRSPEYSAVDAGRFTGGSPRRRAPLYGFLGFHRYY
ncbi:hypothetical protein KM043_012145 [Ampulex compressa]|nr:hypothetical protein KM043_012145 [Ampulex compressa]